MNKLTKYSIVAIIGILLVFLLAINIRSCNRLKIAKNSYIAANSEIIQFRNKYNEQVTKVKVIETEKRKDFLKMQTQDSIIKKLQKLVKETKPQIAYVYQTTTQIDTFTVIDTNGYFKFEDEWISLIGEATDTLDFHLLVRNEFNVIMKKDYAEITNKNPYTTTDYIRIYKDIPRKKKFVVGVGIGANAGVNLITMKPCVSAGINIVLVYKIFEF